LVPCKSEVGVSNRPRQKPISQSIPIPYLSQVNVIR